MIELENITKFYGNFLALGEVSFRVEEGEVLGLLGPNGAGKTTAMRILTCFLPATSGRASVCGFDVFNDSFEVRRHLGYLPETPPLYPEMTVASYLDFTATLREVPWATKRQRIDEVVGRTGLGDHFHRVIGTLSKGFRQRVGLAQALVHDPQVLILDEPTVGLDPNQIIEIRHLIKDLAHDHTIILSTHILSEVSMTCKRVVIINEGSIVAQDSVANLQQEGSGGRFDIALRPGEGSWKEALQGIPGLEVSNMREEDGLCRFRLTMGDVGTFDTVFSRLVTKGHILREVTPVKSSLEEVFLRLTRHSEDGIGGDQV